MLKAIFSFRNPDSTRDFNDRFSKLFLRGFFDGAEITLVTGELKIDVAEFKAMSNDGMVVLDTATTRLTIPAGSISYVVLRAKHQLNDVPILGWEVLEQSAYLADAQIEDLIVRAVVTVPGAATDLTTSTINEAVGDEVDTLGRFVVRGLLSSITLLPAANNRVGDAYVVTDGTGDTPEIYVFNGLVFVNVTQAGAISATLTLHRQNLFEDELHLTDEQAEALIGTSGTPPDITNPYVDDADTRLLSQDENDASEGIPNSILDARIVLPSAVNKFTTQSQHVGVGEEKISAGPPAAPTVIELLVADGPVFVGIGGTATTAFKYFNLFDADENVDQEYRNSTGQQPKVDGIFLDVALTTPINPSVHTIPGGEPDPSGFYDTGILYIRFTEAIDTGHRLSYIKQYTVGTMPPDAMARRKPSDGQLDSREGTRLNERYIIVAPTSTVNLSEFSMETSNTVIDTEVRENGLALHHDDGSFTSITIAAGVNDAIDFIDSNVLTKLAILTPATYSTLLDLDTLAADIQTKMQAVTTDVITVTRTGFKFTITNGTGPYDVLFATGVNLATSAATDIGFDAVDQTGAVAYTSDNEIDRGYVQWTKVSATEIFLFNPAIANGIIDVFKLLG